VPTSNPPRATIIVTTLGQRQLLFCTPKGEKARRGVEGAGRGRRVTYSCTGLRDRPTGTVRDAVEVEASEGGDELTRSSRNDLVRYSTCSTDVRYTGVDVDSDCGEGEGEGGGGDQASGLSF